MAELRRTPLHDLHARRSARMVPFAGFEMPVQFEGIVAEHQRVRQQVGLFDVSHMGEVRVRGPEALDVLDRLVTNDLRRIKDGRAQYTCVCTEDGGIVDDLIVYRISAEDFLICVNAANRESDLAHLREHAEGNATLEDESDAWAQIAVQGPQGPELLGRVLEDRFRRLRPFRVREVPFEGRTLYAATTGYTGEPGGEIFVPAEVAPALWEAFEEAGRDLGVGPAGLGARDTLRLEAGLCLYGNDIDRTTTPLEAGLGWVTKLDEGPFVGAEALRRQQAEGVRRQLVGLEVVERGIPRHGYPILRDGEEVGLVTSGTRSPSTSRNIGFGYVPPELAEPSTEITIDCRGRARSGRVVETPFYESGS